MIIRILLSPETWIGAMVALAGALLWALIFYGPSQYDAGGDAMAIDLTNASNEAQQEVLSDAEAARYRRVECRKRDAARWMYDFARGECVERPAG